MSILNIKSAQKIDILACILFDDIGIHGGSISLRVLLHKLGSVATSSSATTNGRQTFL
jgi:hypothetical protein